MVRLHLEPPGGGAQGCGLRASPGHVSVRARPGAGGCVNSLVQGPSRQGTESRRQTRGETRCSEERKKEGEQQNIGANGRSSKVFVGEEKEAESTWDHPVWEGLIQSRPGATTGFRVF